MPSDGEIANLKNTLGMVRNFPFIYRIYASLVTGQYGGYRLCFAYAMGDDTGCTVYGYCGAENPDILVKEFFSDDTEVVKQEGRALFRGNKYLGTRDPQGNEEKQPFIADHGYQELTGAIRSTFLEQHMILQLVRNVQKGHYPTLYWLVEHGVKVFYECEDIDANLMIEEYALPASPPN